MTNSQIAKEIKEQSKTEQYSAYKQKSQDHKGRFDRLRKAKTFIKSQSGE